MIKDTIPKHEFERVLYTALTNKYNSIVANLGNFNTLKQLKLDNIRISGEIINIKLAFADFRGLLFGYLEFLPTKRFFVETDKRKIHNILLDIAESVTRLIYYNDTTIHKDTISILNHKVVFGDSNILTTSYIEVDKTLYLSATSLLPIIYTYDKLLNYTLAEYFEVYCSEHSNVLQESFLPVNKGLLSILSFIQSSKSPSSDQSTLRQNLFIHPTLPPLLELTEGLLGFEFRLQPTDVICRYTFRDLLLLVVYNLDNTLDYHSPEKYHYVLQYSKEFKDIPNSLITEFLTYQRSRDEVVEITS